MLAYFVRYIIYTFDLWDLYFQYRLFSVIGLNDTGKKQENNSKASKVFPADNGAEELGSGDVNKQKQIAKVKNWSEDVNEEKTVSFY